MTSNEMRHIHDKLRCTKFEFSEFGDAFLLRAGEKSKVLEKAFKINRLNPKFSLCLVIVNEY